MSPDTVPTTDDAQSVSLTSASPATGTSRLLPDYRTLWRWHFYAGLFCIPFVVCLALTGAIYLFKAEIEAALDAPYDRLVIAGEPALPSGRIAAALAAVPDAQFRSYELPPSPQAATRVLVRSRGETYRVYVHPQSLAILQVVREQDRFMRMIFRMHGELMLGDWGSHLVELAASWTIVMILTGLCLWWPRHAKGWGGILYPRWWGGTRLVLRDLHSVAGMWLSLATLTLLLSGLPWAKFWGDYLRTVRNWTGTVAAQPEWANSSSQKTAEATGHQHHGSGATGGRRGRSAGPPVTDFTPVDRIVPGVVTLGLLPPVVVQPPQQDSAPWQVQSLTANRPYRVNLDVDPQTGAVLSRSGFSDKHWIDQVISVGIALHEGRLFGWLNQLLGLLTALGLMGLCVTGLWMWWQRRERGTLGAPRILTASRLSAVVLISVVALGLLFPLFGLSVIAVGLLDRTILRWLPGTRAWLGLSVVDSRSASNTVTANVSNGAGTFLHASAVDGLPTNRDPRS